MPIHRSWLFILCFGITAASASVPSGIAFYRQARSTFASGQVHSEKLLKNLKSTEFIFDYLVEAENKSFWATAQQIARDLDLSDQVLYQKQEYRKISQTGYWALLENSARQRKWAPLPELIPNTKDLGLGLALIQTSMRKKASWSSEILDTVPAQARLKIIKFEDSWALVEFKENRGWVDLNNLLLKADFASYALDKTDTWHKVLYREGFHFLLENKKTLELTQVIALKTNRSRGILIQSIPEQNLFLRSQVNLKKIEAEVWGISDLPGHGKVYFKKSAINPPPSDVGSETLTAFQFLNREIFSVAFDPKNPEVGLASSHGIFKTTDGGIHWTSIPFFKKENHPVTIAPDASFLVGSFRSFDQGRIFSQYLRPEDLTKILILQSRRAPQVLKLSDIEIVDSRIEIQVNTGTKSLKFASRLTKDNAMNWDLMN